MSRTFTAHSTSVDFQPNDFWHKNNAIIDNMPTYSDCELMKSQQWDVECNEPNGEDSRQTCIRYELCVNRDLSEKLKKMQTQHRGSNQDYLDTKQKYAKQYVDFFNLGVGILGVIALTYTLMKNRNNVY